MPRFSKKNILSNQTLGDKLRRTRQNNQLSLENIAAAIQIKKEYILYLERGQYNKLPSLVFIKNYLKKYCEYLSLPWPAIEKTYQQEIIVYQQKQPKNVSAKFQHKALVIPKIFLILVIIMVFTSFSVYLVYEIGNFIQPPDLVVNDLPDQLTTREHSIFISGNTEIDTQVFINGQVILTDEYGNFKENVTLRTGLNTIKILAKKKHSKERIIYKQILVEE